MNVREISIAAVLVAVAAVLPGGAAYSQESAQELAQEDEFQRLEDFCRENLQRPLPVNLLSEDDLERSGLFSRWQAALIVNYRRESGGIVSMYELLGVLGWSEDMAVILENYISFDVAVTGHTGVENYTKVRGRPFENWSETKQTEGYVGIPVALLNRFSGSSTLKRRYALDYGLIVSNSRGERFADFISGFVSLAREGRQSGRRLMIEKLVVGDLAARFGQGLTVWSGNSWNSYGSLASGSGGGSYAKRGEVLSGRNSQSSDNLLRGVGVRAQVRLDGKSIKSIQLAAFISDRLRDARLRNGFYTTLSTGGDHSTQSLLETRHRMNEFTTGLRIEFEGTRAVRKHAEAIVEGHGRAQKASADDSPAWQPENCGTGDVSDVNFKIGFNAVAWFYNRYNAAFHSTSSSSGEGASANDVTEIVQCGATDNSLEDVPAYRRYQQFDWWHGNFSVDLYMTYRRLTVCSECAVDAGGHIALLAGCSARIAQWDMALHAHLYDKAYTAPFSGAVSAVSTVANQHSVSFTGTRYLSGRWQFSTAIAATYFPWCRYRIPCSSVQLRSGAAITFKPSGMSHTLSLEWRGERRVKMLANAGSNEAATAAGEAVIATVSETGSETGSEIGSETGVEAAGETDYDSDRLKAKLSSSFQLRGGGSRVISGTVLSISASALLPPLRLLRDRWSTMGEELSASAQASLRFPYLLSLTAGIFSVPTWDGRLYGHCSSMPYGSSSILLYGNGLYYGLMLKADRSLFQMLGVGHDSWLNHIALWCGVSGVSCFKSALNRELQRENRTDLETGIRVKL